MLAMQCDAFRLPIIMTQNNPDEHSSYLEKISKKPDNKLRKLEGIRNKITNYIKKETNKKEIPTKIENGHVSTYQAIPKASFDTIFLNIYNISKVYLSYNVDRMIFEMQTGRRFVYYIANADEREKMNQLINLAPNNMKIIIINDVAKTMDDPFGHLYCEPK
jgi:hypothetical protein